MNQQQFGPQQMMQLASSMHDEHSFQAARKIMVHLAPQAARILPPHFDPQFVSAFQQHIAQAVQAQGGQAAPAQGGQPPAGMAAQALSPQGAAPPSPEQGMGQPAPSLAPAPIKPFHTAAHALKGKK